MSTLRRSSGSFATTVAAAIAVVVILALGVMAVLGVVLSRQSIREGVRTSGVGAAAARAAAVEQYVSAAAEVVREARNRPKLRHEVVTGNWAEATRVLENIVHHFTAFDYVFVQDREGVIRARVPRADTIGQDFSFRDFFQEVMRTGRPYISGVYRSVAADRPVVAIAAPVLDGDVVAGVLVGALSLETLTRLLAPPAGDTRTVTYVVDDRGTVVAHSRGPRSDGTPDPGAEPIIQAALTGETGTMELRVPGAGGPLLGAHAPVGSLGWGVVVTRPAPIAFQPATRLAWWLASVAAACAAGAIALGWVAAHRLAHPLREVTEATGRLAAGDFSVRVAATGRDELAALAAAFNRMADRLATSYQALHERGQQLERINRDLAAEIADRQAAEAEVRRLNATLEARVAERTRQLEALNRELEAFTYTVSHDLKAPLRGLEGYARALQEDYADRLDETGLRYLDGIRGGASRLGVLIDDLLRYSRLERRAMGLERVRLRPVVEQLCETQEAAIRARALTVCLDLAVEEVEGEPEGLREALANLLENAVKFNREGGTVTISSRREGETVVLAVADTGIGIDARYHDRIFQIFERLHRQEEYPGTGVGLAIVHKVAERHGGRAWVESEPGKGSAFYLALPAREGNPP